MHLEGTSDVSRENQSQHDVLVEGGTGANELRPACCGIRVTAPVRRTRLTMRPLLNPCQRCRPQAAASWLQGGSVAMIAQFAGTTRPASGASLYMGSVTCKREYTRFSMLGVRGGHRSTIW